MLKMFLAVFALFGILMICGCSRDWMDTSFMNGEHSLRKMTPEQTGTSTTTSGGFFLFSGGFSSSSETKTTVKFAWKMNSDTYILSSLPLERIRVKINNNTTAPIVSFKIEPECMRDHDGNSVPEDFVIRIMKYCVLYATVTVKDSDWPIQIQLPLNQNSGN